MVISEPPEEGSFPTPLQERLIHEEEEEKREGIWGERQGKGWTEALWQTSSPAPGQVLCPRACNTHVKCHHPSSSGYLSLSATEPDATAMGGLSNNKINK